LRRGLGGCEEREQQCHDRQLTHATQGSIPRAPQLRLRATVLI
jgi:hypothetical protein